MLHLFKNAEMYALQLCTDTLKILFTPFLDNSFLLP
jgi:hypothetical protein